MTYSADLTGGPLFTEEFDNLFQKLSFEEVISAEWDKSILLINSESAKQRVSQEIKKRLKAEPRHLFWENYYNALPGEKPLMLLYVCAKTYYLLYDFLNLVVYDRFKSFQKKLEKEEFRFFIERQRSNHPELDDWSESTLTKVTNVVYLMMRQAGILKRNELQIPDISDQLILIFLELNEKWFLNLLMVPKPKIKEFFNGN